MNNCKFEKVSRFENSYFDLPTRKTEYSAGYDFVVAEDIIIPPYHELLKKLKSHKNGDYLLLNEIGAITKENNIKPSLVSTGVKCKLPEGYYLELSIRSSTPLKNWLILANGVGIIDADYYNNPDNEGEIFFQIINLGAYPVKVCAGDVIGQGIIKKYEITEDDFASGVRLGGFGSTTSTTN